MNKKYKFILMLLIVLFAISSYFFIKEIAENKKENNIYEDLQEIVKMKKIRYKRMTIQMLQKINQIIYLLKIIQIQMISII